ncbi:MAG: DUF2309 domain-containing protein, partial [Thiothrix sp.]|nr:DUF2309 domain-containing protein [Thiothrix sp.]
ACLSALGLETGAGPVHPEQQLSHFAIHTGDRSRLQQRAEYQLDRLCKSVGTDITLRQLLHALLGADIMVEKMPVLLRTLAAWLDQGMASWRGDNLRHGFYTVWKQLARENWGSQLEDMPDWKAHLDALPDDAGEALESELRHMGIPPERWCGYLERLALDLPGWSGMFLWRHRHPGYRGLALHTDMMDYLAVRLVLEHLFARRICRRYWQIEASLPRIHNRFRRHPAEFLVRYRTFNGELPEYLLNRARLLIDRSRSGRHADHDWEQLALLMLDWKRAQKAGFTDTAATASPLLHDHGWRLFRLVQLLGLDAGEVRTLSQGGQNTNALAQLFDCMERLERCPPGYLWLQAYEHHYREQVFQALRANHERGLWPQRQTRPQAQLIFCMDDREEGFRRHLESLNPQLETLGAAAFFNLPMNWRGLDDATATKLCPVPVHPVHLVREQARAGAETQKARHEQRRGLRLKLQYGLHQLSRSSPLAGTVASLLAAPASLVLLLGKSFVPRLSGRLSVQLQQNWDRTVPTEVHANAADMDPQRSEQHNQQGFTDTEQADLVADFLLTHGLTTHLAPLVVLVGHYSTNQNNPHQAAYGCGACSGRYSGPNARTFATLANRSVIRQLLAERGISIPADCWFIGAEHDTCNEVIRWQDADQVPATHQAAFSALQQDMQQAGRQSARERCRKLASAPRHPTPEQALRHMSARAFDYSQPRPELGHATNALALIGRRSMSQSLFLDRRAFLISYDWRTDPDGSMLERTVLSAGPVGAGISLEYYFSSVDNPHYGCGSKVAHNITGLFGVMQGSSSDLRTGLPCQMIEIHEPMRLLMVLEAAPETVSAIYARQPAIRELIGNGWVLLGVKEPEQGQLYFFHPERGLEPWQADTELPPTAHVATSADWYQGSDRHLPPALLDLDRPAFSAIRTSGEAA